ncbi:outer membrane protein assembly factor BamD [Bombella saccharophila]|uniref:Outer membrane protein assembly factor BamD n=1 Tax=Bombella saccharophila TaxID=2967338 RepID=A0ABT3W9S4_9PROT|nr:outer membrane protein assembly factor BamD [Bombella saccharophila]MCX5614368.1 outer membrane protein assembly factor BamD [Bombella saccharophila]
MVSSILNSHNTRSRFYLSAFTAPVLLGFALLTGCSSDADIQAKLPRTADAETLYNYGIDALHGGHYKLASAEFELLQQNYPYSGYTGNAELMEGYAYYLQGEYALSVQQLERYLQLHPTSPDAAYAYYLRGLCYYEQIGDVSRDQLGTLEAMDALQEVITRFPQTSYARDAQLKVDLCRDHLAGKEMYVGRYYQREKDYQAAYGRYQRVIQDFQTTNHVPEALERLVEVNLDLGLPDEARQAAAVLGYNAPDSRWYHLAYNKLKANHQLTPQLRKPEPLRKEPKEKRHRTKHHRDALVPAPMVSHPAQPDSVITQPVSETRSNPVTSIDIPPTTTTTPPPTNKAKGAK